MRSNTQQLQQILNNQKALELCAKQCGVIGDITKLKICYLLRYHPELSVSRIAELSGTTISNASHSLNKLKDVNIVSSRKEAQTVYYSLVENAFDNVLAFIGNNDEAV